MKNLIRVFLLATICLTASSFKTSNRRMLTYYITFVDPRGHTIQLYGRGQSDVGRITTFIYDYDNNGNYITSGTASGTYDNTNQSTNAYYTPSGGSQLYYSGPATVSQNQ